MIPPLCFITEPTAPEDMIAQSLAAAQGGAGWVQLRHKTLDDRTFARLAVALREALDPSGARLIINDRAEVAVAIGAHGLHIGQDDGDPARIRRRIGPEMILGLSVETPGLLATVPPAVDYLGVGPVHPTGSKPDHKPPIGHDGFARIARATALPCLAIGGITPADAAPIRAGGGAGLAVISAISRAKDRTAAARALLTAWSTP